MHNEKGGPAKTLLQPNGESYDDRLRALYQVGEDLAWDRGWLYGTRTRK